MRHLIRVLVLLLPVCAWAAAPPPVEYAPWTPEDVVKQESVEDFQFSPNGRFVLWSRSTPDTEQNTQVQHLYRQDLRRDKQVQLTRGKESCTMGRWSPDGSHIAFLTSRPPVKEPEEKSKRGRARGDKQDSSKEEITQIWLLDATGGEPWPITEGTRNVQTFAWAGNDAIVFTAREDKGRYESVLEKRQDTSNVVEDETHEPPIRLFHVAIDTKKVTRLTDNLDRIEQLAVSPDGAWAATLHSRSLRYLYDNKIKPSMFLHDLERKTRTSVFTSPGLNLGTVIWAPDSKGFYLTTEQSSRPDLAYGIIRLWYRDLATGKESEIPLNWPRGLALQDDNGDKASVVPLNDGFLALLADGVRHRAARYRRQGKRWTRSFLKGEHATHLYGFTATRNGKQLVYAHSRASSPTQWYRASLAGATIQNPGPIARVNEWLDRKRMARMEVVRWPGARGETVEGLLFYPHAYTPGQRAPLVVQIHGGPAAADFDNWDESWAYAANLVCQRGAFVFRPNYHGSSNYGLPWLESITQGNYCDPELEDIDKGVDALIARGLVDPGRLALSGWSNGGILTNQLITRSTRYRAAITGAGSSEFISDWASCEFGESFNRFYLGKSPVEDVSLYLKKSPFYRLDRVRTPTLIFFGEDDRVVHPQQGWAHYRGLQFLNKTPVRFVLFPGEKHSLSKLAHQRRKLEEELAWLDRYLFEKSVPDRLIKEKSPLGWLLKRQSVARVGKAYGLHQQGVLVPETVRHEKFLVGRFEVTRAQYAAFDPNYRVEAGKENYPASGITYEQARGYCKWLSDRTGRHYRLPRSSESEVLHEKGDEGDNTLDAWAGYAVNPEDAKKLREGLNRASDQAILLREVGMGRGVGKETLVYDLSGNVAEWVEGDGGKGVLRGGSADTPVDDRGMVIEPANSYRGFRILLD